VSYGHSLLSLRMRLAAKALALCLLYAAVPRSSSQSCIDSAGHCLLSMEELGVRCENCIGTRCDAGTEGFNRPGCPVHELITLCDQSDAELESIPICDSGPMELGGICESDGISGCHDGSPHETRPCGRLEIYVRIPCETSSLHESSPSPPSGCAATCPYDLSAPSFGFLHVELISMPNSTSILDDVASCLTCEDAASELAGLRSLTLTGGSTSGDQGAAALAQAFGDGAAPDLETLILRGDHGIGDAGCIDLVRQLAQAPGASQMTHLHLSDNAAIGKDCVDAFGELLFGGAFPALQEFSLIRKDESTFA